ANAALRQGKLQGWSGTFRERLAQQDRNATFADICARGTQGFAVEDYFYFGFHRLPEVTAPLFQHEVQCGVETARRVQSADGFLQNEICSHAKGFLRRSAFAVQDRESDRALVARSVPQALQ